MLFLLWFCSPLPRRGLLARVRFLVKGRVCRSPFCVKFLTLHPSLFAIITHSPNFMILLAPPQNVGKHSLSKPITFVLSLQSSFLLCIYVRMRFCSKEDFGVFTGCICMILSCPTLTMCLPFSRVTGAWFWMLLSAGIFRKCFPMKSGKQRSKSHCYFKGKGHSRMHSKEKSCLQDLSKSPPIPACIVFTSLQSLWLIILFGFFL